MSFFSKPNKDKNAEIRRLKRVKVFLRATGALTLDNKTHALRESKLSKLNKKLNRLGG